MKVLKFGGTSVGSSAIILEVKKIVESQPMGSIVVVSAFKGITDQIIRTTNLAKNHDSAWEKEMTTIRERHLGVINELVNKQRQASVIKEIGSLLETMDEILNGVYLLRDASLKTMDMLLSYGERMSAFIISEVIDNAVYRDSRQFILTDNNHSKAAVNFEKTNLLIERHFEGNEHYAIVPGFIATGENGEITTLGRGGSDYTAAIIAAAINASVLEIWTDVDGFMTADPRIVENAYPIESLNYAEAMELSHFGAKVLYTPTVRPVLLKNIPLWIKNTFNPTSKGTLITKNKSISDSKAMIKGVTSIDDVALITMQGIGLAGIPGVAMRLFSALARSKVNIILITQASSEYSISFAISPADTDIAWKAISDEFMKEINHDEVKFLVERELSIIAVVGEQMKNTPGISAILFRSLSRNGVNVIATAQGSSELNISVVVKKENMRKAVNSIHEGFFLSEIKEINIFMVGVGTVGKALLKQLSSQKTKLMEDHRLQIRLVGLCNSKMMVFDEKGIDFDNYISHLDKGIPTNLVEFAKKIHLLNIRNSVFVDCTADANVAALYKEILNNYASVVTANKIACSSEYSNYQELIKLARKRGVYFNYETNVGAGLPIIKTIDDLINSGDSIIRIEAVLSGTLNFIFNTLSETVSMSDAIKMAKDKGYSEPDPRIDLSGVDVARKILILARKAGKIMDLNQVQIKPFLPAECFEGTIDDFWLKVQQYNTQFENERKELVKKGLKWRFLAKLEGSQASVELVTIDEKHPAYYLEGSNNIILITTERYLDFPMVIKGYGAGSDVTAAGVFADIFRVVNI